MFVLYLSTFEGMQDVCELHFPVRKSETPERQKTPNLRFETPVSRSSKKKRKLSEMEVERKNSISKAIRHEIAEPLEINIIELEGEE